jgi:hypothetical protein
LLKWLAYGINAAPFVLRGILTKNPHVYRHIKRGAEKGGVKNCPMHFFGSFYGVNGGLTPNLEKKHGKSYHA